VKVAGRWRYVYRAIDQYGQIIDVHLSPRRDTQAARRFFTTTLRDEGEPAEVVTDRAWTLLAVVDELLAGTFHNTDQYANNRIDQTMVDSKRGFVQCVDSNATTVAESSCAVTRSCRTFAAGTTNSASTHTRTDASQPRSANSPKSYERDTDRGSVLRAQFRLNATDPIRGGAGARQSRTRTRLGRRRER
jgi:transposase-like protein